MKNIGKDNRMNPDVTTCIYHLLLLKSPVNIHARFDMSGHRIYPIVSV